MTRARCSLRGHRPMWNPYFAKASCKCGRRVHTEPLPARKSRTGTVFAVLLVVAVCLFVPTALAAFDVDPVPAPGNPQKLLGFGPVAWTDPDTDETLGPEGWHWRWALEKRRVERLEDVLDIKRDQAHRRDRVVQIARKYLGRPYVWGGNGPSVFDCSGLTRFVFMQIGVTLPRVAASQQTVGVRVSNPRPGDLVFYGSPAHHVSIYIGGGREIEAPYSGASVRVDTVGSPTEYRSYLP